MCRAESGGIPIRGSRLSNRFICSATSESSRNGIPSDNFVAGTHSSGSHVWNVLWGFGRPRHSTSTSMFRAHQDARAPFLVPRGRMVRRRGSRCRYIRPFERGHSHDRPIVQHFSSLFTLPFPLYLGRDPHHKERQLRQCPSNRPVPTTWHTCHVHAISARRSAVPRWRIGRIRRFALRRLMLPTFSRQSKQ